MCVIVLCALCALSVSYLLHSMRNKVYYIILWLRCYVRMESRNWSQSATARLLSHDPILCITIARIPCLCGSKSTGGQIRSRHPSP